MTQRQTIYLLTSLAAVLLIGITAASFWSNQKIAKLDQAVDTEKQRAATLQREAAEKEKAAEQFKAKAEYLENQLAEIQTIARRQDDELEKLNISADAARADVERTRRIRSAAATAGELCAKLAELGHPCE